MILCFRLFCFQRSPLMAYLLQARMDSRPVLVGEKSPGLLKEKGCCGILF